MSKITYKGGQPVYPQHTKRKTYWWRYLLMWFTGFLSAFVIVGITIGLMGVSFTAKELIGLTPLNIDDILQPGYQNYSVLELATTLSTKKFETLGDIYEVTPLPKKLLDEAVNPVLKEELHFEYKWDELKTKPFQLPVQEREGVDHTEAIDTYLGRALKEGVTIESFINQENFPEMLKLFLYPRNSDETYDYDHPYTLSDYINADDEFFNRILDSVRIRDLIEVKEGDRLLEAIADWSIKDFTMENVNNLSIGLFLDPDSTNPLIKTLSTWTIGMLQDESNFKKLKIAELVEVNEDTPKLLLALIAHDYTIEDLEGTNLYNVLTVEDVFDVTGNDFLEAIKTKTLAQLQDPDTILDLKLGQVFSSTGGSSIVDRFQDTTLREITEDEWLSSLRLVDIYSEDDINNSKILKALTTKYPEIKVGDLNNPAIIQTLTLADVLDDDQIAANSILTALKDVQINELGTEVDNMELGTLLDIDTTDPATPKLLITLATIKVNELNDRLSHLTLGDVMDLSAYPNLDNDEVKNTEINDIEDLVEIMKKHLKLKDVIDIVYSGDDKSPAILIALADVDLVDLADEVQKLTLGELIDCSTHPLLGALSDVAILDGDAVLAKINNLKLNELYTSDQMTGVMKIIWDKYQDGSGNGGEIAINDLPLAMANLTIVELLDETMYIEGEDRIIDGKTYRKIKPVWWFLLTEEGETFSSTEKYYVLKNGLTYKIGADGFNNFIANFTYHLNNETLRDLYTANLINIENPSTLDVIIIYKGSYITVGDLTVSQFMNFFLNSLSP